MLDHLAIHVGYVKRAVGRVGKLHRPEPIVATGEKFDLLFVVRAPGDQPDAVRKELLSVDQIASTIGDEGVLAIFLGERVASIDGRPGRAGEIAGGTATAFDRTGHQTGDAPARADHAPRFVRTDPKDLGGGPVRRDARARRWHGEERVSRSIPVFVRDQLDVIAVAAHKFPAPAVEAHPVLRAAALGAKIERARIERKIPASQIN